MTEAIVIGGGIVGSSVSYHLARAGVETLLVDRADEGNATDAGAGIVSPPTSSRTASEPWFRFAVEAADYYPELAAELRETAGEPVGYARPGLLSVAFEDAASEFDEARERLDDRTDRLGAPEPGAIEDLDPEVAVERFPALATPERAFYYPKAARVDGRTLANALQRAGREHGLTVERGTAEGIELSNGAVEAVVVDGERRPTDDAIVAGGAWSPSFGDELGVSIPIEPHRGQIAHLSTGADTADWPIVTAQGGGYLVPWPDGSVAVGATREADSGFASFTTAGGVRDVLDRGLRTAPGFSDARLDEINVGLRPVSADRLPVLGPVPGVSGAHLASGHGATGLQLGPFSGKVVAELVVGAEPDIDLSAFRVDRFA